MNTFAQVSIDIKANIYFEGNVTSRTILFPDGTKKTLGMMLPGEYNFSTDAPELMQITQGAVEYRLDKKDNWVKIKAGEAFNVPGSSTFDIRVLYVTDYCCSFL